MKKTNIIKINTDFENNAYLFYPKSKLIISEESIKKSSKRRIEMLEQFENSINCEVDVKEKITEKDAKVNILKSGLKELILEVTSNCNMRCSYCIFGEHYSELNHNSFKEMSEEIALNAIAQYYMLFQEGHRYNPNRKPVIAFYGGEPLINFSLIRKCAIYARHKFGNDLFLTLTSNATLLTDEILDFFKEYDIYPIFSLDGPKTENDKHRVDHSGKGTFEIVTRNLERAVRILKRPVFINVVYSVDTNLELVIDYFAKQENFICIGFSQVNPYHTDYFEQFTQEEIDIFQKRFHYLNEEYYSSVMKKKNHELALSSYFDRRIRILDTLFSGSSAQIVGRALYQPVDSYGTYTGTCLPGDKIFVDVEGNIHACEKISRTYLLGNVWDGVEYEKIAKMMNDYRDNISKTCKSCQIRGICVACYSTFLENGCFAKRGLCDLLIKQFHSNLKHYCTVNEINPYWLENLRIDHYEMLRELVVTLL